MLSTSSAGVVQALLGDYKGLHAKLATGGRSYGYSEAWLIRGNAVLRMVREIVQNADL
jgi:hypothetical protein